MLFRSPSPETPRVARVAPTRAVASDDVVASTTPSPNPDVAPPVSAPNGDDGWTFNVAARRFDATARGLGVGATPVAPSPRDVPPKPAVSKTGGVTEALDDHDLKLGISRGGEVLSAMEAVARTGNVPARGNATFVVVVDARGHVDVALQDASEDVDGWSRELGAMRDAVSKRHVRLPPGANGLQIRVRLEARVVYADGRDPRTDGPSVKATGLELVETKTQIVIQEIPSVTVGVRGKVCGAGLTVGITGVSIAGGCSPENAGSPARRVVSGKVVGETRL